MTRYYKAELRIKLADNEEFQPCNILKLEAEAEMNSGVVDTVEAHIDTSFDALGDSMVLIPTDALAAERIIVIVDNTQSDYAVNINVWDSSGADVGEHIVEAGDWMKIHGYAEADETKIKCNDVGETAKVRVVIIGEAA